MSSPKCCAASAPRYARSRRRSRPSRVPMLRACTTTITVTSMATTMTEAALYRLMTWLSPAYPVGAFSYSHGLEYAVEERLVRDRESLIQWLTTAIEAGAGHIGGALLAEAWRGAADNDAARLEEVAALAAAWRSTRETALESEAQGA